MRDGRPRDDDLVRAALVNNGFVALKHKIVWSSHTFSLSSHPYRIETIMFTPHTTPFNSWRQACCLAQYRA